MQHSLPSSSKGHSCLRITKFYQRIIDSNDSLVKISSPIAARPPPSPLPSRCESRRTIVVTIARFSPGEKALVAFGFGVIDAPADVSRQLRS